MNRIGDVGVRHLVDVLNDNKVNTSILSLYLSYIVQLIITDTQ